jgi:hypothetical protein
MKRKIKKMTIILTLLLIPFIVIGQSPEPLSIMDNFDPSGYMGCNTNIVVDKNYNSDSLHQHCIKFTTTVCDSLWSGVYWQHPANNWCKVKGLDLNEFKFTKISFSVKGDKGDEVIQFAAGNDKCDSYSTFKKTIYLKKGWQNKDIKLVGKDLSNVSSSLAWFVDFKSNSNEVTFYIDSIKFE